MKNRLLCIVLLTTILTLGLVGKSYAEETLFAPNDSIELKGTIFNNTNRIKNVIVNIYDQNTLIKKIKVKSTNRFITNVPKNSLLTIEITAKEYHTKRFIFDTQMPASVKKLTKYEFDIDIFKESELEGVNTSFLDFPVGLVSYDKGKDEFRRNKKYTKRMKKTYLKLWAEAQAAERQGKGLK